MNLITSLTAAAPILSTRRRRISPSITTEFTINSAIGNSFRLSQLPQVDSYSTISNFRNVCNGEKRRSFTQCACSLVLPLLPFPLEQVLVPSESKTLHLYEARYLELLEESISRKKKLFVHFVLDPIVVGYATAESSFAARYGCLVVVEKVDRLDVGALVSVRGIGRVTITKFEQADPYLIGVVLPLQDSVPENLSNISSQVLELKQALYSLNSLEIKLKATKEAVLQTQTANSLLWSEKESLLDCDEAFIPSVAEWVSFAALQPISDKLVPIYRHGTWDTNAARSVTRNFIFPKQDKMSWGCMTVCILRPLVPN